MSTHEGYSFNRSLNHHVGSQASNPPRPGSPTLSNPDMILPDYPDYGRSGSPEDLSQHPIHRWEPQGSDDLRNVMLLPDNFVAGPMTPTTPIIYGNGTMLSDIGEVTEVESNAGGNGPRRTSSRYSNQSLDDLGYQSSPTMGNNFAQKLAKKPARERRDSIESTSTVRSRGHARFADVDDAVSVDDANFQGDDEESMASSYIEEHPLSGQVAVSQPDIRRVSRVGEPQSTGSLSHRAEVILANAKKRLNTMEGNLSRARSSLGHSDESTPSPPLNRPRTALNESGRFPVVPSHTRNKSDDGLHAAAPAASHPERAASALGAAGGYRKPAAKHRGEISGGNLFRGNHLISNYPVDAALEALGEDEIASVTESQRESGLYSNSATPTFGSFGDRPVSRASSAAHVRELQDQMQGLKGKISSLKEQARADSLKRRSLQSLRTPSPFTHSQWDHGFGRSQGEDSSNPVSPALLSPAEGGQKTPTETTTPPQQFPFPAQTRESLPLGPDNALGLSSNAVQDGLLTPPREHVEESPVETQETQAHNGQSAEVPPDEETKQDHEERGAGEDDTASETAEEFEDADSGDYDQDYDSDGGESEYHESFQQPVSHEDREDAFDYEHFFLHSAMGSLRQSRRDSASSTESEDSIVTARGPDRRASVDTTASDESFQTAEDGLASRTASAMGRADSRATFDTRPRGHRVQHSAFSGFSFHSANTGEPQDNRQRSNSILHRPIVPAKTSLHRPSVSSFESTGTNRSFPLVNKTKINGGVLTPGGSPEQDKQLASSKASLMDDAASIHESLPSAISMLSKEDQILVEGLIAGLGKCVLSLSEGSRAGTDGRLNIRRLEAARRILEGIDEV